MGKRSQFERNPRDFYATVPECLPPLIPFLPTDMFTYAEPCAGNGALIHELSKATGGRSVCQFASDIEPQIEGMKAQPFEDLLYEDVKDCDFIITNPPWNRKLLHPMIDHFSNLRPTWLLFDANWMFTKQARPFMESRLHLVATIGRVKWIPGTTMAGKDDSCWYCFRKDARRLSPAPLMYGKGMEPVYHPQGFDYA